jgi:hypothetical protein
MGSPPDIHAMAERIERMKQDAEDLKALGEEVPAVHRNAARILASLKMLEINISDVAEEFPEAAPTDPKRPG